MKEEIEKFFSKHEKLKNNPWLMIFLLIICSHNNEINIEELDNMLKIIEKGDTNLQKEELNSNEQSNRNAEDDKKS